ncbi:MAG: polysaccharide lyase [Gammaproteobacteria bacterium]|nr:polysaccharide lyase [Gammaproteobacteria bacterium]
MVRLFIFVVMVLGFWSSSAQAFDQYTQLMRVGKNSEFKTIQSAINASVIYDKVVILIEPGVYEEKLFITRNNLTLLGHSEKQTLVKSAILREHWRAQNPTDWGAAVININATDINLINISVLNDYGRQHNTDEHQFAVRGFGLSDRIITHNCSLIADGADTLSLWNKHGRYYHSNCYFEGAVDFVCPRGTALIENSTFYNIKQSATLWHDGELDSEYKLVVNNSSFDGIEGFWLGRHHYDAQFYLLNSKFSVNMADKPIFKKKYNNKNKERANLYGARYFFQNNFGEGNYDWTQDNFRLEDIIPQKHKNISQWVFKGQWQPKKTLLQLQQWIEDRQLNVVKPM